MAASINGENSVGIGTYAKDGDFFEITVDDSSKKININDGIKAGGIESSEDKKRSIAINWNYSAKEAAR